MDTVDEKEERWKNTYKQLNEMYLDKNHKKIKPNSTVKVYNHLTCEFNQMIVNGNKLFLNDEFFFYLKTGTNNNVENI